METDWGTLGHAYGPADGIPGLLRAMESEDAGVREEALRRLGPPGAGGRRAGVPPGDR
ncbi:hypothetical protein GCM10017687_22020 [Streptomyces echinatus]|uniref:hypothetical protein n=1 Tax=Streptomyces echinatus TaxID=67293 RepID=UPI0031EBC654